MSDDVLLVNIDDLVAEFPSKSRAVLTRIARDVSARFISAIGHQIFPEVVDDEVTLRTDGSNTVKLPAWPVREVRVWVRGVEVKDFQIDKRTGILRSDTVWERGLSIMSVKYTHGLNKLPADIEALIFAQCKTAVSGLENVASMTLGSRNISFNSHKSGTSQVWVDTVAKYASNEVATW